MKKAMLYTLISTAFLVSENTYSMENELGNDARPITPRSIRIAQLQRETAELPTTPEFEERVKAKFPNDLYSPESANLRRNAQIALDKLQRDIQISKNNMEIEELATRKEMEQTVREVEYQRQRIIELTRQNKAPAEELDQLRSKLDFENQTNEPN
jgi:hypothetical protein